MDDDVYSLAGKPCTSMFHVTQFLFSLITLLETLVLFFGLDFFTLLRLGIFFYQNLCAYNYELCSCNS